LFLHDLRHFNSLNPTTIPKAYLPTISTAIVKMANELLPPYRELDAVPWDEMEVSLAKHGLTPELAEACVGLFITIKVINPSVALWLKEIEKVAA